MYRYRTMCEVLEEIRSLDKTKNYSPLLSLVEELQVMGNRMEASLQDNKEVREVEIRWKEAKKKSKFLDEWDKNNKVGEEDE